MFARTLHLHWTTPASSYPPSSMQTSTMSSANRSLKKDAVQGTLNASLNYCLDSDSGCIIRPGTVKDKLREYDIRQVRIEDIRGREREFRLDVHGFQHIRQATKQTEFSDRSNVTGEYYAEVEALLKRRWVRCCQIY